jgi:hypothetical protein
LAPAVGWLTVTASVAEFKQHIAIEEPDKD